MAIPVKNMEGGMLESSSPAFFIQYLMFRNKKKTLECSADGDHVDVFYHIYRYIYIHIYSMTVKSVYINIYIYIQGVA